MSPQERLATEELVVALLESPDMAYVAQALPKPNAAARGRPRVQPPWVMLLYGALMSVYRSANRTDLELGAPGVWDRVRILADARDLATGASPPTRDQYRYLRDLVAEDQKRLEDAKQAFRIGASETAVSLGLLVPARRKSWTTPELDDLLYGDGTVVPPLYRSGTGRRRDPTTGMEVDCRHDPDARTYTTGGGKRAYGLEYVTVLARGREPNQRIVLDYEWVPRQGREAGVLVSCLKRLGPLLPGAVGVIYDGALRGTHIERIQRGLGWLVICPVTAARVDPNGGRVERSVYFDTISHVISKKECRHELYCVGGRLVETDVDETGAPVVVGEPILDSIERRGTGPYRIYGVFTIKCPSRDLSVRLPAWQQAKDTKRGFSRAEHLRLIPPGSRNYLRIYPRRADAESSNRDLKRTLVDGRAHSLGHVRQEFDLLGWGLMVNAQARLLSLRRGALAAA